MARLAEDPAAHESETEIRNETSDASGQAENARDENQATVSDDEESAGLERKLAMDGLSSNIAQVETNVRDDVSSTKRRKTAKLKKAAEGCGRIDKLETKTPKEKLAENLKKSMEMAIEGLKQYDNVHSRNDNVDTLHRMRLISIRRYFQLRLAGILIMMASLQISQIIWNRQERFARRIREWA